MMPGQGIVDLLDRAALRPDAEVEARIGGGEGGAPGLGGAPIAAIEDGHGWDQLLTAVVSTASKDKAAASRALV